MTEQPSNRVPADVVHEMLRQDGRPITPATLRSWTHRGHITHTADGYDLAEVIAYLHRRHTQQPAQRLPGRSGTGSA